MRQRRDVSPWTLSGLTRGMNCNLTTKMVRQEDGEFENILSWSVKLCLKRKKKKQARWVESQIVFPLQHAPSIHSVHNGTSQSATCAGQTELQPIRDHQYGMNILLKRKLEEAICTCSHPPIPEKNSHPVFFFCQNLFCLEKPLYNQGQTKRLKEQETSQNNPKEQGQENPVQIASALPSPARNSLGCTERCNVRAHFSFPHSLVKLLAFP